MTTKTGKVEIGITTGDSLPSMATSRRSSASRKRTSRPVSRPLTPLIGREREVQEAETLLRSPEVRLLTITGVGGVGKSRLALQVAAEAPQDFADGSCQVELAYCRSREQVERAIAYALGLRGREAVRRLESALKEKHLLLVLDNFEQAMEAASLLPELLVGSPRLKIMVTSRVVLRVQGEFELPIPPLSVPFVQQLPEPEALLHYGAVALFMQRAQALDREFEVTEENALAIAAICVKLDGLPLALELAAAHTKLLSPQQLLLRLEKPLEVLTRGGPDLPERQQTLRTTIEWSYALLTSEEQAVFRRLAVFVRGCALEAAEAVCTALGEVSTPVMEVIASLLDQSLLQQGKQESGETRLVLLKTLREYGLECLQASGKLEGTRQAHAAYYLALAEQAEPFLGQGLWLEQLEREHDNLFAALVFLLERKAVEEALRLAGALRQFWFLRDYLNEGRSFLEQAVTAMGEDTSTVSPQVRAKTLFAASSLAYCQLDFEQARRLARESLELSRRQGDARGAAVVLRLLGIIEARLGDADTTSDAFFAESLRLFRETGDALGTAMILYSLGEWAFFRGEFARAQELCGEGLTTFRALRDSWHIALTLHLLGWASYCQGAYAAARRLSEESVDLFRRLGNPGLTVEALTILSSEVAALGEESTAAALLEEALALATQGENWEDRALTLWALGQLALRQGDLMQARARYGQSLAELKEAWTTTRLTVRTNWIAATCLEGLGEIALRQGQAAWTVRLLGAAETLRVLGVSYNPVGREQLFYERTLQGARGQVEPEAFAMLWAQGQAMTPEEVLALLERLLRSELAPGSLMPAPAHPSSSYGLTARELEVLRLLAGGLTNRQIAQLLVISPKTVNIHVASLYKKLNITSRTAATRFALDHHLVR